MTMTLLQLQVCNWWSFSYIISANLFALLFHFLLINDVRMTTFTHQLLSRKTSTSEVWQCEIANAIIPAAVLRARRCVARGLRRSHFHATRRKVRHHAKRCLAKTIATRHVKLSYRIVSYRIVSRWDVAINLMVTAAERCSHSHHQKHRNMRRENLQFTLCTE